MACQFQIEETKNWEEEKECKDIFSHNEENFAKELANLCQIF
jgi:hypothetical protein